MKKWALILIAAASLAACSDSVGTKSWCKSMESTAKADWTAQDAVNYAKYCVFDNAVGSKSWCNSMKDKPKGDWTGNETLDFSKYCLF